MKIPFLVKKNVLLALVFIFLTPEHTQAQLVSIGTTSGGANAQIGASIASIISSNTELRMRPQKASGSQQVLEMVNRGKAHFGVANVMQYDMAVNGVGLSEGKNPMENIRLVSTLMPFIQGVIVRNDSNITIISDLKGKRVPIGYLSSPLFTVFWDAFLLNAGISYRDVIGVPVASLPKSWEIFKEGQVDAVIAAAGSASVREMAAMVPGGIRYLPIEKTTRLTKLLPSTRIELIYPEEGLDGISEPTNMHVYEYVLFVSSMVNNTIVNTVAKAIYESNKELKSNSPLWKDYQPENISMDHGLQYHPGAAEYYKSIESLLN